MGWTKKYLGAGRFVVGASGQHEQSSKEQAHRSIVRTGGADRNRAGCREMRQEEPA